MYITIVFILTGLRRRCIINALGYVEESVKVCIIFHNMVGWASVCAVTWRSPCARRLFLHSFSIQAVCVHRNSRLERTPELVTALWWQTATSLLFQYQYCLELLACLFLKYYKAEQDKKTALMCTDERDKKVYSVLSNLATRRPWHFTLRPYLPTLVSIPEYIVYELRLVVLINIFNQYLLLVWNSMYYEQYIFKKYVFFWVFSRRLSFKRTRRKLNIKYIFIFVGRVEIIRTLFHNNKNQCQYYVVKGEAHTKHTIKVKRKVQYSSTL